MLQPRSEVCIIYLIVQYASEVNFIGKYQKGLVYIELKKGIRSERRRRY